jgi:nicotinamidase-related amidase
VLRRWISALVKLLEGDSARSRKMNTYTQPEFARSALLTIDTQRDFILLDGPAVVPGTIDVVPNMRRLALAYRQRTLPIVHILRLYLADGSNVDACRRSLVESGARIVCPGSEGAELMADLKPSPEIRLDSALLLGGRIQAFGEREWALYKPRWGAFYETCLEDHLRALGVNTIVVTGCNFPNCPRATIYEASERDFRVVLVDDAVSGLYDRGRAELRGIGVSLPDTDDLISTLSAE